MCDKRTSATIIAGANVGERVTAKHRRGDDSQFMLYAVAIAELDDDVEHRLVVARVALR